MSQLQDRREAPRRVAHFLERVAANIASRELFSPGQPILVAVSGGVDSMVLLHALHSLSRKSGWNLTVAHLNHRLRGASSFADERLVSRAAERLNLPIVVSHSNVRDFAKTSGLSLEMAARKFRHEFLARTALELQIPSIALAHHLNDQVELFFLRLFRGSGSQGLAGMKWSNPSPSDPKATLVRPLLNCPKSLLLEYAAREGIGFREDKTNASLDFQRNRIRHELLPLLERQYQPGVLGNVLRVMDILGAESAFVSSVAKVWRSQRDEACGKTKRGRGKKPARSRLIPFEALSVAVQRHCLQLDLIQLGIIPEFDVVEHLRLEPERPIQVRCLVGPHLGEPGEQPQGTSTVRLVREPPGIVRILPAPEPATPFRQESGRLDFRGGDGEIKWHGVRIAWHILPTKGAALGPQTQKTEIFDADRVGREVILRHWRPGDRFQPIGLKNPVKLQDLFVNQKVPRARRRDLLVATTAQGELFWVEGLRMSERFKLTKSTIRRLHWAWQRL